MSVSCVRLWLVDTDGSWCSPPSSRLIWSGTCQSLLSSSSSQDGQTRWIISGDAAFRTKGSEIYSSEEIYSFFFWFCLLLLLLSRWDYTEAIRGELLVWSDHETQREEASEQVSCCVQPAACRTAETVEINTCCSPSLCCSNRRLGLILCILQNNKSTLAVDFWISYFNFDSQVWSRLSQQQVERRKMLKWISAEAANT